MGKMQRDKGKRGEREIVNLAKAMGLQARRCWETAQGQGYREWDVIIAGFPFQVKMRQSMRGLYKLLEGNVYGAFVRENKGKWLAVIPANELMGLLCSPK